MAKEFLAEVEESINRPPDEVFMYLSNHLNEKEWRLGQEEIVVVSGVPGQVGARYRRTRRTPFGFGRFRSITEVTNLDPTRREIVEQAIDASFRGSIARWKVEPEGSGSRVVFSVQFRIGGLLSIFAGSFVKKARSTSLKEFAKLKTILEMKSP